MCWYLEICPCATMPISPSWRCRGYRRACGEKLGLLQALPPPSLELSSTQVRWTRCFCTSLRD